MIQFGATVTALSPHFQINRTSRLWKVLRCGLSLVVLLTAVGLLSAEEIPALGCIGEMVVPVYSGPFWRARITGAVRVEIVIGSGGKAADVRMLESPHPSFGTWLPGLLKRTSYTPQCGGQTIELTFKYRLQGEGLAVPDNLVVIKSPGIFEITAHPPKLPVNY